jgi:hypothetical protein
MTTRTEFKSNEKSEFIKAFNSEEDQNDSYFQYEEEEYVVLQE